MAKKMQKATKKQAADFLEHFESVTAKRKKELVNSEAFLTVVWPFTLKGHNPTQEDYRKIFRVVPEIEI